MSIAPVICDKPNCKEHGCIFCRIIQRKEPARIIAETDRAIAIFPLGMVARGHTLVIPKNHVADLYEADWVDLSDVMWLVKDVSARLKTTLNCGGMNLIQSSGECATQSVYHIHFHLVPRDYGDRWTSEKGFMWPSDMRIADNDLDQLLVDLQNTHKETSAN